MTERDTRSDQTVDTDGQRSADPATPAATPPPAVPSAFGSAPAGWQPGTSTTMSDASAPAEPAPVTGTHPLPVVPSRRSLRGKPPVSTAAIPVVPKPVAGAPASTPAAPPTPTTRPVAPSNAPAPSAVGADAPTAAVAPTASDAPTAAAPATRLSGSVLPRRTAGSRATVADAAPAATGSSVDAAPVATGSSAVPPAVSFDQTVAGPDPSSAVPAPPTPTPQPAWHPITGATQVVAAADAPWKPVTGAQPVVPAAAPRAIATPSTPAGQPDPTRPQLVPTGHASAPEPPASGAVDHSEEPVSDTRRSRRGLWITLIVVGVLVLGGAGAAAWYLMNRDQPAAEQQVVQAPSPTSALTAIDRTATTAFAADLPATVLQYALTATADDAEWTGAGALESYLDTYADEAGDQLTVHSGQWATAEEATAQQAALATAVTGEVLSTGPVTVAGTDTGVVTVVDRGDGTGTAVWNNGTAVFVLTAPVADVSNAFAAYPV
ncbi:hypothetical protein [Cellulomonas sp. RIT-PI-Y]|uniref:hypothetical protein n=1 Tax=Cellulomonas sp. RIT-PI-Y TaxID=3035297 RepID=UPI0021DA1E3D|nr:hypothetical protein [Cellulomonas sp. RIT-PI-Y]